MSTGKTNITSTQFAAKKLLGKAHTSNLKSDVNETIPSNVSVPSKTVFGEDIPNNPGDNFFTMYSASVAAGGSATVERVYLDIVSISDTIYDADSVVSGGGGSGESSQSGPHGYYLKLPANYETTSSNPRKGTGVFTNNKRIYDSRGELQLVPPLISNASPNKYFLKLYKGDPTNAANEITSGDVIDWQFDYYSGVIFIQDYSSSKVPLTASAYLYVGKYLDDKINDISSSGGGSGGGIFTESAVNRAFTTSSINVGSSTPPTKTLNVKGTSELSGGIIHKRIYKTSNYTATISDYFIGVNSSGGAFAVTLPDAATSNDGQTWVIKDEGGAANTNNITISASGSQQIDGENSVVLESPYASIQLYSNGSNKFYIF